MRLKFAVMLCLAAMGSVVGQEQEVGMLDRIWGSRDRTDADPMQNKSFMGSNNFESRTFSTSSFAGAKSAEVKEFSTRSFFGIKNPWFGREVYETGEDVLTIRDTRGDLLREYGTGDYGVKEFGAANDRAGYEDQRVTTEDVHKETSVQPKAQGSVDEMSGNLTEEMSIEQVRKLLNKGQLR